MQQKKVASKMALLEDKKGDFRVGSFRGVKLLVEGLVDVAAFPSLL